jgi:hypothetical protein
VNSESVPSKFRTRSLSPGLILLPAFLPIKVVLGLRSSYRVFCSSPLSSIFQGFHRSKFLSKNLYWVIRVIDL